MSDYDETVTCSRAIAISRAVTTGVGRSGPTSESTPMPPAVLYYQGGPIEYVYAPREFAEPAASERQQMIESVAYPQLEDLACCLCCHFDLTSAEIAGIVNQLNTLLRQRLG